MSSSPSLAVRWSRWLQLGLTGAFVLEVGNAVDAWAAALMVEPGTPGVFAFLPGPVRLLLWGLTGFALWHWQAALRPELARLGLVVQGWNLMTPPLVARLPTSGVVPMALVARVWPVAVLASGGALAVFMSPLGPSPLGFRLELVASIVLAATMVLTVMLVESLRLLLGNVPQAVQPVLSLPPLPTVPSPTASIPMSRAPTTRVAPPAPAPVGPVPATPVLQPSGGCVDCGLVRTAPRCPRCGASLSAGPFRVVALLGKREYARTYRAVAEDGTSVVLKELWLTRVPDTKTLDGFDAEVRVLASLKHPRIPRFIESFTTGAGKDLRFTLAMDDVRGTALSEVVKHRGPLALPEVERLVGQTLDLLIYLQRQQPKVLHRDVKPANLIRRPDGSVVLVDFGVARVVETAADGTLVGTVGYMPPEQLAGRVDETSDLYALGVTAIHLLTGLEPVSMLRQDARLTLPTLPVPQRWQRFLRRLTSPDWSKRYPDAVAARRAFARLSGGAGPRRWWLAAAGAVVVVLAGALVLSRTRPVAVSTAPPTSAPGLPASSSEFPERPIEAPDTVLATYPGGEVTVAEALLELRRLPPAVTFQYPDFQRDLVQAVATLEQLDQVARQQRHRGASPRERVASLARAQFPPDLVGLIGANTRPADVRSEVLARLVPQVVPWRPAPRLRPRTSAGRLSPVGGAYRLTVFPEGTVVFDDFDAQSLSPRDWLLVELATDQDDDGDLFRAGAWAPFTPPEYHFSAMGPNWRVHVPPRPPLTALLERYRTTVQRVTTQGQVSEPDAREHWQHVSEAMGVCLAAAAWERRWQTARVRATLEVEGEGLRASTELFVDAQDPLELSYVTALLTRAEACGVTLKRWRFPRNVKGRAVYELLVRGTPWTTAEQETARQASPEWFQRFTVNLR
jgi:serine/threonine protein kinase